MTELDESVNNPGRTAADASDASGHTDAGHATDGPTVHYWMELLQTDTAETLASYKHPHWAAYIFNIGSEKAVLKVENKWPPCST